MFTLVQSEIVGEGPAETGKIYCVLIQRASLGYAWFKFNCCVEPTKKKEDFINEHQQFLQTSLWQAFNKVYRIRGLWWKPMNIKMKNKQYGSFWNIDDFLSRQNRLISIVSNSKNLIFCQTKNFQIYLILII